MARLGRCGRTARRAPCGAEPEARAWFPAGRQREECFRGLGRTCGDERGVASALAGGVREGCVRPAAERGAGPALSRVGSAGSRTARPEGHGPRPAQALRAAGMVKAKGLKPERGAVAEPGLVEKRPRKKKKKRRFRKNKAREVSEKPGGDPTAVLRPPKAPEDFSQNWKALQEVGAGGKREEDSWGPQSEPWRPREAL